MAKNFVDPRSFIAEKGLGCNKSVKYFVKGSNPIAFYRFSKILDCFQKLVNYFVPAVNFLFAATHLRQYTTTFTNS